MREQDKEDLERWLTKVRGEVNTWTWQSGVQVWEARAWRSGAVHRFISESSREHAIDGMKVRYYLDPLFPAKKDRCASCPQAAVATVEVRVAYVSAVLAGLTLTGRPTTNSMVTVEEVPLCARCMAGELSDRVTAADRDGHNPAEWVKKMRAVGP